MAKTAYRESLLMPLRMPTKKVPADRSLTGTLNITVGGGRGAGSGKIPPAWGLDLLAYIGPFQREPAVRARAKWSSPGLRDTILFVRGECRYAENEEPLPV